MATTSIDICARALVMIGASPISSFSDGSTEALVASNIYTDRDATSSIVGSGYFNSAYAELKQGDMILVAAGVGGTMESDLIVVSSATGATTVTTAKLA